MNCSFGANAINTNIFFNGNHLHNGNMLVAFVNSSNWNGRFRPPTGLVQMGDGGGYYGGFYNCGIFNQRLSFENTNCKSLSYLFNFAYNFNSPVVISDSTLRCDGMFQNVEIFNQQVKMGNNLCWANNMFRNCGRFNKPVVFPYSEGFAPYSFDPTYIAPPTYDYCFANCGNFNSQVTFGGTPNTGNFEGAFSNCQNMNSRVSFRGGNRGNYIFWNCRKFNKPVDFSGFQYLANAMVNCTNFNSTVFVGSAAKSCYRMMENCYNFNKDIYFPDGCNALYALRGCNHYRSTVSTYNLRYSAVFDTSTIGSQANLSNTAFATVIQRANNTKDMCVFNTSINKWEFKQYSL